MSQVIPIQPERSCGKCTACCEGHLEGAAYGHGFWKGRPCYYLNEGCSIYPNRPDEPCKSFLCFYMRFDWLPQWMRPDLSGVIIVARETEKSKIPYIRVSETDKKMSAEVLSFLVMEMLNGRFKNMAYQINGGWNRIGTQEFLAEFN